VGGGGEVTAAIQESFGSFDALKSELAETALNVQGSGWGALAWEPVGQRLVVEQVYDHQSNIGNGTRVTDRARTPAPRRREISSSM
jgi:superoxide dismutase, Fe-Mn family